MDISIFYWVVGGLLTVINLHYWHGKKTLDAELRAIDSKMEEIAKDVHSLANKQQHFTTQSEVRDLIRDSIEPLAQSQKDTMVLIREMNTTLNNLSRDLAVIHALRERESNRKD